MSAWASIRGICAYRIITENLFAGPYMGLAARKPVFGVSDKASFKPVSSATETSSKIEISPAASLPTNFPKSE